MISDGVDAPGCEITSVMRWHLISDTLHPTTQTLKGSWQSKRGLSVARKGNCSPKWQCSGWRRCLSQRILPKAGHYKDKNQNHTLHKMITHRLSLLSTIRLTIPLGKVQCRIKLFLEKLPACMHCTLVTLAVPAYLTGPESRRGGKQSARGKHLTTMASKN